jgi:hypothetical protein
MASPWVRRGHQLGCWLVLGWRLVEYWQHKRRFLDMSVYKNSLLHKNLNTKNHSNHMLQVLGWRLVEGG